MEWSNDKVVSLIDSFRDRPVLWNCKLKEYKDKNKKHDAYTEIAASFGVDKDEVERKLKNLICHFSREVKKEKDSAKSGEDVYKSKWFAYRNMAFLKNKYQTIGMTSTQLRKDPLDEVSSESEASKLSPRRKKRLRTSLKNSNSNTKQSTTDAAPAIMKDIQEGKSARDQYILFGEQVGMQIRELPSLHAKKVVIHLISNILFEAEMGKYDNPLISSHIAPLGSQPPIFGNYTSLSSFLQTSPIPNRVPTPSSYSQHFFLSPTLQTTTDPETTDSGDSMDSLLKEH